MMHPHTELRYIDELIGFGVFATQFIPKGTLTWALDDLDQILDPEVVDALDDDRKKLVLKYSYRNQNGKFILCWDNGRYVNHSFHANCIGTAYEVEIAIRDIYPGEQLTDDYGSLNVDEPFDCLPEEGTDRSRVMPGDLLQFADLWDAQALEAFRHYNEVEQPLAPLIRPEFRDKVEIASRQNILLDSIREIYFDRASIMEVK
ncbi:SET domain-containing protein-lysine N-methyltransferase [Paenibacillus sp. LMG 31456]|uniref:SET domain-containing protein-lysine N-methyltransferase n=1 Tax=Paenibacillus foliorum TaxID=2654974 RepID=A0A972GYC7_9BACL|nr:SET domain-containing protein [Paenibacillus foliorum]NOU96438.1 SET domain-containing protein-lysine N-methyltransferase [Paenibacillus foliorum]